MKSYNCTVCEYDLVFVKPTVTVTSDATLRGGYQNLSAFSPSRIRTYTPRAFQQRLASGGNAQLSRSLPLPVPHEISFHCPCASMGGGSEKKAVRQFSTVSGPAQHLESGACVGGKRSSRCLVGYVQEETKSMSLAG